jgi:hypothetical protein
MLLPEIFRSMLCWRYTDLGGAVLTRKPAHVTTIGARAARPPCDRRATVDNISAGVFVKLPVSADHHQNGKNGRP